jgi:hypothetical protein
MKRLCAECEERPATGYREGSKCYCSSCWERLVRQETGGIFSRHHERPRDCAVSVGRWRKMRSTLIGSIYGDE